MKNFILIVFILISNVLFSQSIKVETRRGWTKTIPVSDIIEAGNDYGGTYDSDLDQTEITIEDKIQPQLILTCFTIIFNTLIRRSS